MPLIHWQEWTCDRLTLQTQAPAYALSRRLRVGINPYDFQNLRTLIPKQVKFESENRKNSLVYELL